MQISTKSISQTTYTANNSIPESAAKQKKSAKSCISIFNYLKELISESFCLNKCIFNPAAKKNTATVKTEKAATPILPKQEVVDQPKKTETINLNDSLALDSKVITEKLDNGFTYSIRSHAYPSTQTACLRLVVRAGSTDENPGEEGLAHFLEHMLFHETESYAKTEIERFLESKGVVNGADKNAHTTYNETVYKFDIPLNDPQLLDKALHIISEMMTKAKLSNSSVEGERAIILDEITSESAIDRYRKKLLSALLEGTPYPNRSPEGLKENIQNCTPDQLRAFYQRTYQPQNMGLIAVGDFDCKQVEELIHKHFSGIKPTNSVEIKHGFQPTQRTETLYQCCADPESDTPLLYVYYPLKIEHSNQETTVKAVLHGILNTLYHSMFNSRLQEIITDSAAPPFSYASSRKSEVIDDVFYYRLALIPNDGETPQAYKRILLELKRILEHGFLPEELELAKKLLKSQVAHTKSEIDKIGIKSLAETYATNFSQDTKTLDSENILNLKSKLIDYVKIEHIEEWGKFLVSKPCALVSSLVPKDIEDTVNPDILRKIHTEVFGEPVSPYTQNLVSRPLLRKIPQPAKILSTTTYEKTGITEWKLENGMRVFIRPSSNTNETVWINACTSDGTISVPLEKLAAADMASDLYMTSGVAGLTYSELQKILKSNPVNQKLFIGTYASSLSTTVSKKNLETAFQLIHTAYTDRTSRKENFENNKKEYITALKYEDNDPESYFIKEKVKLCTQNHPRFNTLSKEQFEQATFEDCDGFLNYLFQNPADFDVVITGNFDSAELKNHVETYLASIPSQAARKPLSTSTSDGYDYPPGIVVKEIKAGIASNCETCISFPAAAHDDFKSRNLGIWVARLLEIHLNDVLRVKNEKSYGVACIYALTPLPGLEGKNKSSMELGFSGLPENIHELNNETLKALKELHKTGFSKEQIESIKAQLKEEFRKTLDHDGAWLSKTNKAVKWNFDLNELTEDFYKLLDSFDEKCASEKFRELFPLDQYVQVTLLPEG